MINFFLGAALVAAPFFFKLAPHSAHTLSQEYFFALVVMVGVLIFGIKKTHKNFKIIAVCFFVLAFVTKNPFGLYPFYQLVLSTAGTMFTAMIYSHKREINYNFIKNCLGTICVLESIFLITQISGIDPYAEWFGFLGFYYKVIDTGARFVSGSLGNINNSAAIVAVTLPFLRPIFWVLPLTVLLFSNSTMPVITSAVAILAMYSYRTKNYKVIYFGAIALFLAAASLIAGLIPAGSYFSDSHRLTAWKLLWKKIGFQLYGLGFGYVPDVFSKIKVPGVGNGRFYSMHNEWIELYAIGGLLAVGVGIYLILPVFKNKGNAEINACLIALLVNSLGNFTFHIAPLFMIFGTCYALQLKDK